MGYKDFRVMLALPMVALLLAPSPTFAKRMITGTILTPAGKPAVGVTVKAFDEDDPTAGNDALMGRAITNAQGRYTIGPYDDQRWDTYIRTTSWRPDIYIKVYQIIAGREVAVGRSRTHKDHRQAQDLSIDIQLKGIVGTVTERGGTPAKGVLMKAFDEDDLSQDDFMNEVRTDPNGNFAMTYEQKYECENLLTAASCWDTPVPGSVSWRPDIYIEVHDVVRGRQIKVNNKSATTRDVPHRSSLQIQASVPRHEDIDYTVGNPWEDKDVLHVLAYNTYLRPRNPRFLNGQAIRVPHIVREVLRDKYDVIVFSEVFDDELRTQLRESLASSYPYHAKVPETSDLSKQDGGVKILSKWPIENGENLKGEHRVFGDCRDCCLPPDCSAEKGVVYVKINKNGTRYHIFGTHVQADVPPSRGITSQDVRRAQFQKIKNFIDEKGISATEAVIIAGDLNVDKCGSPVEYNEMLQILNAMHPPLIGHPWSIDEHLNDLGEHDGKRQLLDYVLYSRSHRQPARQGVKGPGNTVQWVPAATNRVMFYRSDSRWREFDTERYRWDISDHYPVCGRFIFGVPASSIVPVSSHLLLDD